MTGGPLPAEAVAWLRSVAEGSPPTTAATSAAAPVLIAEIDRMQKAIERTALAAMNRALQRGVTERWANPGGGTSSR